MDQLLTLSEGTNKTTAFKQIEEYLHSLNIAISERDEQRPWGGFFVIDEQSTQQFIATFFTGYSYDKIASGHAITPKILLVEPHKRLSLQYHERRQELWSVITGPVGVVTSKTDDPEQQRTANQGEIISIGAHVRHRLIGLENYGVVAEFWVHTNDTHPSDEDDITRVQDDYSRT